MAVTFFGTVKSFASFLAKWVASGGKIVDQNTANLRAAICAQCHSNKKSSEVTKGCSTCMKGARTILGSIRSTIIGTKSTPHDSKLLVCEHCGCDNRISVWIPNAVLLTPEEANAFPSFCYKKAVLEGRDL